MARGGKEAPSKLKVVGDESAQGEVNGRSLLDEIAREGARRMLVAAPRGVSFPELIAKAVNCPPNRGQST
jgi:hypothetical protein